MQKENQKIKGLDNPLNLITVIFFLLTSITFVELKSEDFKILPWI